MIDYLRSRRKLLPVVGLWTGLLLTGFNVYAAVTVYLPQYRVRNDFRLLYGAVRVVAERGWPHLYDLYAQDAVAHRFGFFWQPFINPPPLVWLGAPFAAGPCVPGLVAWSILLLAALGLAWWLAAPGGGVGRAAHLTLLLGLFPVAFGVLVGQSVALVIVAVAASWRLARAGREVWAGVALALMVVKPQVALLVPLCLLVAGRWRPVAAWAVAAGAAALGSLALLGTDGLHRYLAALAEAGTWQLNQRFTIAGVAGGGLGRDALQAVVLAAVLLAAWRQRQSLERVVAIGLVGSAVFVPYIGLQDLAALALAGWLVIRSGAGFWLGLLLAAGYAVLELALVVQTWPVWGMEIALLLSLLAIRSDSPDRRLGRDALEPLPAAG